MNHQLYPCTITHQISTIIHQPRVIIDYHFINHSRTVITRHSSQIVCGGGLKERGREGWRGVGGGGRDAGGGKGNDYSQDEEGGGFWRIVQLPQNVCFYHTPNLVLFFFEGVQ